MPDDIGTAIPLNNNDDNTQGGDDHQQITVSDEQIAAMAKKSGDSEEHIREMLGIAGETVTPKPAAGDDKGLLAGKFKSESELGIGLDNITQKLGVSEEDRSKLVDALGAERAYKYYESQLGQSGSANSTDGEGDALSSGSDGDGEDALSGDEGAGDDSENSDDLGFDVQELTKEFMENGELSEASYKKLEDAGLPKDYVDQYIRGYQAEQQLYTMQVHQLAGGQERYDTLVQWGAENLSDAEVQRFDEALYSGDIDRMEGMMAALQARYEKANGSLERGGIDPSTAMDDDGATGFASPEQMTAAMKDPRYAQGDLAYHKWVQQMLKNAKF